MKKIIKNAFFVALSAFALGACKAELETAPVTPVAAGSLDFSNYVAVGNSLTSGFADNGLYLESQQNSYPQFLNDQFAKVGGNPVFNQPLFAAANSDGSGYLKVTGYSATGSPIITPFGLNPLPSAAATGSFAFAGPTTGLPANSGVRQLIPYAGVATANQNLGIPGLAVVHVTNAFIPQFQGYALANPYFERLLTPAQKLTGLTYINYINSMAKKPSFFTCWLGNNDVLGYATGGGTAESPSQVGAGGITPASLFNPSYDLLVNALTANGAKGVLATIPDVTALPYFTTVKASDLQTIVFSDGKLEVIIKGAVVSTTPFSLGLSPIPATGPSTGAFFPGVAGVPTASQIASFFNAFYLAVGYTDPGFVPGANAPVFVVQDVLPIGSRNPSNPAVVKKLGAGDFIVLPFGSAALALIAGGGGFMSPAVAPTPTSPAIPSLPNPFADQWFLDESEVKKVKAATAGYNAKIKSVALAKGLAFFDAAASFTEIISNGGIDDVVGGTALVTGGLFSLDGVHLTPRGYGTIANQFIKAINAGYNTNIPLLDVRQRGLRGVRLP